MPKDQLFYTNGTSIKNITLPQYPNSAWNWIANPPEDEEPDYFARVAAVYRVANMSAEAIASMPFVILDEKDNEVDLYDDWQNKVGFMPNPRELLRLWRLSLFMTNTAYGFMEGNQVIKNLRYIVPTTITPIVDKYEGIIGFKRTLGADVKEYSVKENRIFWAYRLDHTTELLPSKNTEFQALMNAAGVLYWSDEHIKNFFERGGIKPTMLMVKGVPTKEEREKVENLWTKVITGTYKFLGKVFNAESIEPHVIGEGVDNLKDSTMHEEKIADIALAAGMPLSLLLANSANYATANVEYATWFNHSVIPWAEYMQDNMNEKLFNPIGYHWEFRPEITNMGTEEERERAGAYAALVASNVLPGVAAQMLGYELPPDYTDYSQLDDDYWMMLERKKEAAAPPEIESPEIQEPKPPKPNVVPPVDRENAPKAIETPMELSPDQFGELMLWRQFAFRKHKRGEELAFPFVCKELDEATAATIRARLPHCRDEDDIRDVFDLTSHPEEVKRNDLLILADSLNRAVETMVKPEPIEVEPEMETVE